MLGQDARETLVQRLKDGTATVSEATKEVFLKELFDLAQEVSAPPLCLYCHGVAKLQPVLPSFLHYRSVCLSVCLSVCRLLGIVAHYPWMTRSLYQVVELKLGGQPHPKHGEEVVGALIEVTAMKRTFRCDGLLSLFSGCVGGVVLWM